MIKGNYVETECSHPYLHDDDGSQLCLAVLATALTTMTTSLTGYSREATFVMYCTRAMHGTVTRMNETNLEQETIETSN